MKVPSAKKIVISHTKEEEIGEKIFSLNFTSKHIES